MFSLSVKQSWWINLIFTVVFGYLLIGALLHFNIISILLYGVFVYISGMTLKTHWARRMYPFDSGWLARKTPWRSNEGNGKRW